MNIFTVNPLLNHVRKNKFLPTDTYLSPLWSGTDTKETFEKNLKAQSQDWYYRTHKVTYKNNSQGYRTDEFDKINWAESIVIFGCSNAYGVGLSDEDTISSRLSEMTGRPVVNLGSGGSSMTFALHNSIILDDGYPTPFAVVYIWPDYTRVIEYNRSSIKNHGSWNMEPNSIMDVWNKNSHHAKVNATFIQKTATLLWQNKSRYFEGSFSGPNEWLGCKHFKNLDKARDLLHPGIESAKLAANDIAKGLQLCK
jgi:hypothetical protein